MDTAHTDTPAGDGEGVPWPQDRELAREAAATAEQSFQDYAISAVRHEVEVGSPSSPFLDHAARGAHSIRRAEAALVIAFAAAYGFDTQDAREQATGELLRFRGQLDIRAEYAGKTAAFCSTAAGRSQVAAICEQEIVDAVHRYVRQSAEWQAVGRVSDDQAGRPHR